MQYLVKIKILDTPKETHTNELSQYCLGMQTNAPCNNEYWVFWDNLSWEAEESYKEVPEMKTSTKKSG